jgi:hypothetical protein
MTPAREACGTKISRQSISKNLIGASCPQRQRR